MVWNQNVTKIFKVPARSQPKEGRKLPWGYHLIQIWYQAGMVGPMSQLSQSTVMFVVNLKKSFKVIVKSEKIEQNKPDKQMY